MEKLKCKYCKSDAIKIFQNGAECQNCKTVSVIQMPTDDEIKNYYLKFNENYTGGGPASNQILYAIEYKKLVNNYCKNFSKLLDVGCSNSPFPNLIINSNKDLSVAVLDVIKPLKLSDSIIYYNGLIDNQEPIPEENKFDVITAWAVIEHVKNVEKSFENISNALNENGYFFITTPEIGTWLSNFNIGKTPWFSPPEHLHIMSPICLKKIAKQYGLSLIKNGHFEISLPRFIIRYYIIGLIETIIGVAVKIISKKLFDSLKLKRVSKYKGIHYLVFQKAINT